MFRSVLASTLGESPIRLVLARAGGIRASVSAAPASGGTACQTPWFKPLPKSCPTLGAMLFNVPAKFLSVFVVVVDSRISYLP